MIPSDKMNGKPNLMRDLQQALESAIPRQDNFNERNVKERNSESPSTQASNRVNGAVAFEKAIELSSKRPAYETFFQNLGVANPFNLEYAFNRLKSLLAIDGDKGPRTDVPSKGFYLNISI